MPRKIIVVDISIVSLFVHRSCKIGVVVFELHHITQIDLISQDVPVSI
jgi:hypothetical protein